MLKSFTKILYCTLFCVLFFIAGFSCADTQHTIQTYNKVKADPERLMLFLQAMPKGADLHVHTDGAAYALDLINEGKGEGFCINPKDYSVLRSNNCRAKYRLDNLANDPELYNKLIDAWSMRNFPIKTEPAEQHFFATFLKYMPLVYQNIDKVIADILNRAARQHESYIELMIDATELHVPSRRDLSAAAIGNRVGLKQGFAKTRLLLLKNPQMQALLQQIPKRITNINQGVQKLMHCGTSNAEPGCKMKVKYLYIAFRNMPPAQFFAQLVTAFETAKRSLSVVGVNIVMPENGIVALRDYDLQMQMIHYLHQAYPKVNISLHAGELAPTMVPPKDLTFHIRDAVDIAGAQRIGHGVDIAYEKQARDLLAEMAKRQIMVEINLTSNADVLGVKGKQHPLPLYLKHQVPVALSTDDEAVERTDLTREYQRAILTYDLSYSTVKNMVRNSIQYSFLPGKSLWLNNLYTKTVKACRHDKVGSQKQSKICSNFLTHSEKAELQWQLERQFNEFEHSFS